MTQEKIVLAHGGGGVKTSRLIEEVFLKRFRDPLLRELDDGAVIGDRVFTTDSFVVRPLFFPGGDIGKLAVCGTVNDIAVMGAEPLYLSVAFILEEGFEIARLEQILDSISETAAACGARIVTGDTKVVEKGKGDGLYINTSGIGRVAFPDRSPCPALNRGTSWWSTVRSASTVSRSSPPGPISGSRPISAVMSRRFGRSSGRFRTSTSNSCAIRLAGAWPRPSTRSSPERSSESRSTKRKSPWKRKSGHSARSWDSIHVPAQRGEGDRDRLAR